MTTNHNLSHHSTPVIHTVDISATHFWDWLNVSKVVS